MTTPTPEMIREKREAMGLSQAQLASLAKTSQQTVDRIEAGTTRHSRAMPLVLQALGFEPEPPPPIVFPANFTPRPPPALDPDRPIPVHASAEGGPDGALIVDVEPFEWVERPSIVAGIEEAYLIVITGESMADRYRPGERAIVNPRKPPMPGADCIFRAEPSGKEWRALIKELVRATSTHWVVRQHNPKAELRLSRKEWVVCHRVVGRADRD